MITKFSSLEPLKQLLSDIAKDNPPFSFTIALNVSLVNRLIDETKAKIRKDKDQILSKYCVFVDGGGYLGRKISDDAEERIINPSVLDELEMQDREECYNEIAKIVDFEIKVNLSPIDLSSKYFNQKTDCVQTIEEYINMTYCFDDIMTWIEIGLIVQGKNTTRKRKQIKQ